MALGFQHFLQTNLYRRERHREKQSQNGIWLSKVPCLTIFIHLTFISMVFYIFWWLIFFLSEVRIYLCLTVMFERGELASSDFQGPRPLLSTCSAPFVPYCFGLPMMPSQTPGPSSEFYAYHSICALHLVFLLKARFIDFFFRLQKLSMFNAERKRFLKNCTHTHKPRPAKIIPINVLLHVIWSVSVISMFKDISQALFESGRPKHSYWLRWKCARPSSPCCNFQQTHWNFMGSLCTHAVCGHNCNSAIFASWHKQACPILFFFFCLFLR